MIGTTICLDKSWRQKENDNNDGWLVMMIDGSEISDWSLYERKRKEEEECWCLMADGIHNQPVLPHSNGHSG